jgi:hypothetical protein
MLDSSKVLVGIPAGLRDPLLQSYQEIGTNFAEHRWEPSELNGGKFCEVAYTIIIGTLKGSYASKPAKPANMVQACRDLENTKPDPQRVGDRSLRILIPRMLVALYEIRNNRGVGHAGGDVDPNFMDATVVYGMASWTMAELVRVFHGVSTHEAQETADVLVERKLTLVWQSGGTRRVQDPKMKKGEQALVLLYSRPGWVSEGDLYRWVEYSSESTFRENILRPFHQQRLIEYEEREHRARISPLGSRRVEEEILERRTNFRAI